MMISSGITLTAFAAPLPDADTGDAPMVDDDVIVIPEPTEEADTDPVLPDLPFELVDGTGEERPISALEGLEIGKALDEGTLFERLPVARDGGRLIRGDYNHRAPADILLIDDDDSTAVNTTQEFNNSGVYDMDVGKLLDDTMDALNIDHDVYVVDSGMNGPNFETMTNYTTLIWAFGYEWGFGPTLTRADIWRVRSFMDAGGSVWFIGNGFFADIYGMVNRTVGGQATFTDDGFAKKYLGIEEHLFWTGLPDPVNSSASAIMTGSEQYDTATFFNQFGSFPGIESNIIRPKSGAIEVLVGDSTGQFGDSFNDEPNTVAYDSGSHRVVTSLMDVANIVSDSDRRDFVDKVMTWLGTPTLSYPSHSIFNWYVDVEDDHSPIWSSDFNFGGWGGQIYNFIGATLNTHKDFDVTAHFENHANTNERNFNVRFLFMDAAGNELQNFTKQASVGPRKTGEVSATLKATRSGFYFVVTNITIAQDPQDMDNVVSGMFRLAEWMDDHENDTKDDWTYGGSWSLVDDADESWTRTHAWRFQKNQGTTTGDELVSPDVDIRFYNTSADVPTALQQSGLANSIWFNLFFTGRLYGTGQDSIELLMKASNMTNWRSLAKYDGTTQVGQGIAPGDFSGGWYRYTFGIYMGDYAGQTLQFKWKFVKGSQFSTSYWSVDDVIVWQQEERNVAPWFLEKTPQTQIVEMDVGTSQVFNVTAQDPTFDEPITFEWYENYQLRPDWTGDRTTLDVPLTVPPGDKYERGNTLNIAIRVKDDLAWNDTFWTVRLMDPKPGFGPMKEDLIELDEDEAKQIDFGTSQNVRWFEDPEGQTFTVTSTGSTNIEVTEMGNNVLEFINAKEHWHGVDNITLRVEDSAGSVLNHTVMVRVHPVNDAPKWISQILDPAIQDMFYSFNLTATDVDNEVGELTYEDDADFFDISSSAEISFIPRNEHVGTKTFNVTVRDPDGLEDTMELQLKIENVNDPPTLRYIPPQTINEDERFQLNLSEYVEDPDLLIGPGYDHIIYRDDTPKMDTNLETGEVVWDSPENFDVGEHFVKFTITDSKGRFAEQEVRIEVVNAPDPPSIQPISKEQINQEQLYTHTVEVKDDDMEDTFEGKQANPDEVLTFSNDHQDLFIIDAATGRITFTPENLDVGLWHVNITVVDSDGLSDKREVIFEVVNKNDEPTIEYIPQQEVTEDVLFELQVFASDPDMELRNLDNRPVDPDETLTFSTNSSRVTIDGTTGLISFTPTNEDALRGSIAVKIEVRDADAARATVEVLFNVIGVNDPPENLGIIGLQDNDKVRTDKKYQLMASAEDVDHDEAQLTYKWFVGSRDIGSLSSITWKPKGQGLKELKLVVTDPEGATTEYSINVKVQKIEEDPGFEAVFGLLAIALISVVAIHARRRRMA